MYCTSVSNLTPRGGLPFITPKSRKTIHFSDSHSIPSGEGDDGDVETSKVLQSGDQELATLHSHAGDTQTYKICSPTDENPADSVAPLNSSVFGNPGAPDENPAHFVASLYPVLDEATAPSSKEDNPVDEPVQAVESEEVNPRWHKSIHRSFPLVKARVEAEHQAKEAMRISDDMKNALAKEQAARAEAEAKLSKLLARVEEDTRQKEAMEENRMKEDKRERLLRQEEERKREVQRVEEKEAEERKKAEQREQWEEERSNHSC